jgi:hypothetical protein
MSKTDRTKPFWVKLMHGDLATEELHNHADGDIHPGKRQRLESRRMCRDWQRNY